MIPTFRYELLWTRLKSKKIVYDKDFVNVNRKMFLADFKLRFISWKSDDSNKNYEFLPDQVQYLTGSEW